MALRLALVVCVHLLGSWTTAADVASETASAISHVAAAVEGPGDQLEIGAPWKGMETDINEASAPTAMRFAMEQGVGDPSAELWSAYMQPATANMQGIDTNVPTRLMHQNYPRHRMGHLAVRLPPGARNLRLNLRTHENFVFGTAYSPETAGSDDDLAWYHNVTSTLFDGLTPENSFKWFNYEPQPGNIEAQKQNIMQNYTNFAQEHGYKLTRGHTLEWYKVNGFWPHQLSCDKYVAALRERITRDVAAFKGKFQQFDVFNEIVEIPGMLEKCNLWDTAFPDAFKLAHEMDPDAQLCLNDFSLIEANNGPKLMKIIQDHLLPHGAPIHCIGIQAHFEHYGLNLTHQQEKLDLLATLGLDLYITEFTLISTWFGPNGSAISYLDEETAANATMDLFKLWFSHPAVKGIFMWGFWDKNIWAPNAGIYKADRTPKKAAIAIRSWLDDIKTKVRVPDPGTLQQSNGWLDFSGYYGTYEYSYHSQEGELQQGVVRFSKSAGGRRQSLVGRPSVTT